MSHKRVGSYFIEKGLINDAELAQILEHSKKTGLRFGDAARDLEIIQTSDLIKVFGKSFETEFFYLDPTYFPAATKEVFTLPEMVRLGVLALGLKKSYGLFRQGKYLNIGLLDPSNLNNLKEIEAIALDRLKNENVLGIKVFLVLSDQFLDVLREVYGKDESEISGHTGVDKVLSQYLGA